MPVPAWLGRAGLADCPPSVARVRVGMRDCLRVAFIDRLGGVMFAAAWPLSTIGIYGTGATPIPGSVETVVSVAVVWFFAFPWAVSLY